MGGPVVVQRDEFGAGVVGVEVQHRVPDVVVPVVGRFAEDPDVDDETGSDLPLPRQAAVGAHDDLGAARRDPRLVLFLGQGVPPEIVERQRGAVHEVHVATVDVHAALGGQLPIHAANSALVWARVWS